MTLITDKPEDLASTNGLDLIPDDLLVTPPAYLKFSPSPCALDCPPAYDDVVTYCVRAKCSGEHGPLGRGDGELRYERSMKIQAIWKLGDPEPPDVTAEQPALFDEGDGSDEGDDAVDSSE